MLSAVKNTCFCPPHTSRFLTIYHYPLFINIHFKWWCITFCPDFIPKYGLCSQEGRRHGKTYQRYLDSTKALYFSLFARNRYGVMTEVNQTLKLEDTPKINNRNFDGGIAAILSNTNTGTKYKYRLNTGTIFF